MSKQALINHVVLLVDSSSSMSHRRGKTVEVADSIVRFLAKRSEELNQETRATVYTFSGQSTCVYYDKDVLRMPSIADDYRIHGNTALVGATRKAISELKQTATLYGDHAFVVYVITDGEENASTYEDRQLIKSELNNLPENWTMAVLVPDSRGRIQAQNFGFPAGNIAQWDTTNADGIADVGKRIEAATNTFMENRTLGVRGTKSLFENVKVEKLAKPTTDKYVFIDVTPAPHGQPDWSIKEFVQGKMGFYQIGSTFYELVKPEKVQASKKVAILDKSSGLVYSGSEARDMIGLPNYETRLHPESHPKYQLFVQSKSVTRKLPAGSKVLVMNV